MEELKENEKFCWRCEEATPYNNGFCIHCGAELSKREHSIYNGIGGFDPDAREYYYISHCSRCGQSFGGNDGDLEKEEEYANTRWWCKP